MKHLIKDLLNNKDISGLFFLTFPICLFLFSGCNHIQLQIGKAHDTSISDIAYNITKQEGCLIYVEENNSFVPYYVISSNYGENALLVRKHLLEDAMPFNENKAGLWDSHEYGGYYEDSSIDTYLNAVFIDTLNESVRNKIVDSNIVITDKNSLGITGDETKNISRKIFLLSLKELNCDESSASVPEGNALDFFVDDYSRRVANLPSGEKSAYWTRTPETWETYTVFTIGNNGIGSGSADIQSGVRPAFCVDKSLSIIQSKNVIEGQNVYIFE